MSICTTLRRFPVAENSKIEWTHHTVNFWWGCSKVSPACANCYAEGQAARFYSGLWGKEGERRIRMEAARLEALRYERRAMKEGCRFRVFTNSMSDFFEDRRDLDDARYYGLGTMFETPHLDWLVLTKRPERISDLLLRVHTMDGVDPRSPFGIWLGSWLNGHPPANVWLGTTVEDQDSATLRIPELLRVPASVRFLSCEPLLGMVDLEIPNAFRRQRLWKEDQCLYAEVAYNYPNLQVPGIDWVICGGESGPKARPMHPDWARSLRHQCAEVGVPFLFKQWGEWILSPDAVCRPGCDLRYFPDLLATFDRVGKKVAGRLLDGMDHSEYPVTQASA